MTEISLSAAPQTVAPSVVAPAAIVRPISFGSIARPGAMAILRLWKPFVAIQLCGILVVWAYFNVPAFTAFCGTLAAVKAEGGFLFSALALAIASGLAPEVMKYLTGVDRVVTGARWRNIGFAMSLFAIHGVLSDGFYRLLAAVLGDTNHPPVVAAKVLLDQFVYTTTLGCGGIALAYAWRASRYNTRGLLRQLNGRWYLNNVGRLLVPCWIYWIPMATLMYLLPADLTFVFAACASAASSLIFIAVASTSD